MRIFLTGMPGAGKSYLGNIWARKNDLDFYDLDKLIEDEERRTIAGIFEVNGEGYFREKEAAILRNTDRFENCIIACGGGTPCFFDNMDWMNRNGLTVFLDQSPGKIIQHLSNMPLRPVFRNDPGSLPVAVAQLLEKRWPFYNQAALSLSSEQLNDEGFQYIQTNMPNA